MHLMLAAPWQDKLVAAPGAVGEEVDFRSQIARIKTTEISSLKPQNGREEIVVFFKELLEKMP